MDHEGLCTTVFEIDPKIRFVAIYHKSGHMLCGGMRDGLESYLPREELTRSAMYTIMRWETRSILFPFIGEGKYSMTEYDKIKRLSFPLNRSELLLVATEVTANHNFIIDRILEIARQNFS